MGSANKKAQLKVAEEQRRLSKEDLLTPRIKHKDVFIEGLGGLVKLKSLDALTRKEIRAESGVGTDDYDEHRLNMLGLLHCIEEPQLTEHDLKQLEKQDGSIIDELILQVTLVNVGGDAEAGKVS